MLWAFPLLLLTSVACTSSSSTQQQGSLCFQHTFALNLDAVNENGGDLGSKSIELIGELGSASIALQENRMLTLEHTREGFVGVFRRQQPLFKPMHRIQMLYPSWNGYQVNRLPSGAPGDMISASLPVREQDIILMVLPHQTAWPMDLVCLNRSLEQACQTSQHFKHWASSIGQLIHSPKATIIVVRLGATTRSYRVARSRTAYSQASDFPLLYDPTILDPVIGRTLEGIQDDFHLRRHAFIEGGLETLESIRDDFAGKQHSSIDIGPLSSHQHATQDPPPFKRRRLNE